MQNLFGAETLAEALGLELTSRVGRGHGVLDQEE
jgi:hypothetical protein